MLRRWMTTVAATGTIAVVAACTTTQEGQVSTEVLPTWEARLAPAGAADVRGEAVARALPAGETVVSISVDGDVDAGYPWHIHAGECGSGGPIVGSAGAYPVLFIDASGAGTAEATLDVALDVAADYYVNVHASANELGTIVACGELETS